MTGRRLAWPTARTGRDGEGATGDEEPSRRRRGGSGGGGIGGLLARTGELSKTTGDRLSCSESSTSIVSDLGDFNIRERGPGGGLLAMAPASSESANSQARLSSSMTTSGSFISRDISRSRAPLLGLGGTSLKDGSGATGSGATTKSKGSAEGKLSGDGEADTPPEGRGGVEYRCLILGDGEGAADVHISIID